METAVGLAVGLGIGVALTIVGSYVLGMIQKERLELGYEVLSSNIIIPKLKNPTPDIQVMVRESLVNQAGSTEAHVAVDEIRGFRVRLRNTGNQVIGNQHVNFELDQAAKVISLEAERVPDLGGASMCQNYSTHPRILPALIFPS